MCQKKMDAKYGNEMVKSEDGKSSTSRAHTEANEMYEDLRSFPYLYSEPKAKIERT
jgi:hypothetical protein